MNVSPVLGIPFMLMPLAPTWTAFTPGGRPVAIKEVAPPPKV